MNILESRPTLCVQTTFLHESDRAEAANLGSDLYNLLTRPVDDTLAFGAGIPVLSAVQPSKIELTAASKSNVNGQIIVIIPVLGSTSFFLYRREILKQLHTWHNALRDSGAVLVVPLASQWRSVESQLPSKQLLSELYGQGDHRNRTLGEIILALTRLLAQDDGVDKSNAVDAKKKNPSLFISHSKADLAYTDAATRIHEYVVGNTTGSAFFDAMDLVPGESLSRQLDSYAKKGVLLAIRGDAYSSRSWCQRELLTAKRNGVPTVIVDVLRKGEKRSSPYSGNAPTIVWNPEVPTANQAADIVLRAMVEWLRSTYFLREAERIKRIAELPIDSNVLPRSPELLDIAQGRIRSQGVVLYPDPELPVAESQILKSAYPRLQVVTPTTAYRRYLSDDADIGSPLEGQQIAISISDSPDVDGPEGFTKNLIDDTIIYLARTLISSGATIAYGGDFRMGGYTDQLSELVASYNETATNTESDPEIAERSRVPKKKRSSEIEKDHAKFLCLYQEASIDLAKQSTGDLCVDIHHLSNMPSAIVPFGKDSYHPKSLYLSDMRRVMANQTMARVIVGGKITPRLYENDTNGYSGIYPGILEESWRSLLAKKPLYVVGGFGGAAGVTADLLQGKQIPSVLISKTWKNSKVLFPLAESLRKDKYFKRLKLPATMEEMARLVQKMGRQFLRSDAASVAWNGLTLKENLILFRSRDPLLLASLVLKGLLAKNRKASQGKLKIELVHGSVTRAEKLSAIAVATFDDIPLGGAGAALDRATSGQATRAHVEGQSLVRLDAAGVEADWLYLASLGPLGKLGQADLVRRVRRAADATRETVERHCFRRFGVVAFGGAVAKSVTMIAKAMLDGLRGLGDEYSVTWFETNAQLFEGLRKLLESDSGVALTTRQIKVDAAAPATSNQDLVIQVGLNQNKLYVTVLPPSGTAIASSSVTRLSEEQLFELSKGEGPANRETPSIATLATRGKELTNLLLGVNAKTLLQECAGKPTVIVHDIASSRLPFELMATERGDPLAAKSEMNRRLIVPGAAAEQMFARTAKVGQVNLLLIANPTGDLPGTEKEARAVQAILKPLSNDVKIRMMLQKDASKRAVMEALAVADVVHYCGHAFFDGPGESSSGLLLTGQEILTQKEMRSVGSLPRIAFVNACEAGRVRGVSAGAVASAAFAEFFLRSGIEAYLGTYWRVSDQGAAQFATNIYSALAGGMTLDAAVRQSRQKLFEAKEKEWANYLLYGNGRFRLMNRQ